MTRPGLWTRAQKVWRTGGTTGLCRSIAQRAYRHSSAIWHERDLTTDCPVSQADIAVRVVMDDLIGTVDWLRSRPHDERELSLAVAGGHLLARADLPEGPIGCVKAGWGDVWVTDFLCCLRFPSDTAFIYDTYVAPAYRRKGVARALLAAVIKELASRSFRRVFCHIPEWNVASRRLYGSLGFVARRRIRVVRLFSIPVLWPHPKALWSK